ncbi:2-dehydro-3-deoxygalactonokinase [Massilia sp. 9096]|uniref:2-dehydro-3-deoxygalactonokinase n=1 Tax=Massilia sp. 9096 TaxID=1500894 RepID=UPI0005670579
MDGVAGRARLLALDWGSTHLRAYLLGADGVRLDERDADAGASTMNGDARAYEAALEDVAGHWLAARPDLPIVACGMVGSQHGWREAPYAACPAGAADLAGALARVDAGGRTVAIVPGVSCRGEDGVPDVIRGEETQIVGALAMQPDLAAASTLVLPGTHSKWASVEDGRIVRFSTYMTGELFALLRAHSVLGRLMQGEDAPLEQGFDAGVRAAAGSAGLTHQLFAVRTLGLTGELAPAALSGYLSGLLIGSEIDAALRARAPDGAAAPRPLSVALVGAPALTALYERALALRGVTSVRRLDNTAPAGLWRLAAAAGLITDLEGSP